MYGGGLSHPMVQLQQVHGGQAHLAMPPQPQVSLVPQVIDDSPSTTGTEVSGPSRHLKPMISDSDHRLKTAQNQAKTEEALFLAQQTKRRRLETALQTQELEARIVIHEETERTKDKDMEATEEEGA